ncbi:hypothetical protein VNI00_006888 [Paramarasmius palmivorus]|uniref:Uncharacterized protein n=1 Tax=Paramarasmius palmivorus TaxID=297713 RepID=A0AAW0D8A6_9AGAR
MASTQPLDVHPVVETMTVTEWREGSKRVIERQGGPGEDVQVEVIPADGAETHISLVHRLRDRLQQWKSRVFGKKS